MPVYVQSVKTPKGQEFCKPLPGKGSPGKEIPSYYAWGLASWGRGRSIAEALRLAAEGARPLKLAPGAVVVSVFEVWEDTVFVDQRGAATLSSPEDSANEVRLVLSLDSRGNIVELMN